MLSKADATPMIAVKDLDRARQFYEETLGLTPTGTENSEVFMLKSGETELSVYRSEFAGTNKATLLTFDVGDIEQEVRELKDKGVTFEHYDLEGLTPKGDIYKAEGMKTAWFKDPDGNILSLIETGCVKYEAARLSPDRFGEARSCLGRPPRFVETAVRSARSTTSRGGT
jgi:catechol 2,3-dioxygenase-like lactoylglutathione lyase family enzyme